MQITHTPKTLNPKAITISHSSSATSKKSMSMAAAATSRFLHTTTTTLFLLRHRTTTTTTFLPPRLPFPLLLQTSRLCSTLTTATEASVSDALESHPWPEWEGFVEKLKGKGYFDKTASVGEGDGEVERGRGRDVGLTSPSYYTRIKVACLGFARERPDLLRSLPKEDIQAVVECGCPNLLRKTVNSAKRLRAYLKIDEGDVCSTCNLRGTCDRAYIMANKDEGARTVDIVRILLQYAAEPLAVDLGEKPPVKESVEESVRKLLLELIKLSDTIPSPELLKSTVKPHVREELPDTLKVWETKQRQSAEMKRGDWICPECNYMNYARNVRCLQCKGDGPKRVNFDSPEMKKGDWTCPRCQFMNFARNTACRQCQESRPKKDLEPGEWECPKCDFLNFRRNRTCLKCNCVRPLDESSQNEDGIWRRPRMSTEGPELL